MPLIFLNVDWQHICQLSHSLLLYVILDPIFSAFALIELVQENGGRDSFGEKRLSDFIIGEDNDPSAVDHLQDLLQSLVEHIFRCVNSLLIN